MKPSKLVVELEEKDVEQDLGRVINAMSRIRAETLANNACSPKQQDEYLHLTYRLASGIEALVDQDTIKKMDSVAKEIDKDERLLWYDYTQEGYWKRYKPNFTTTLDKVVIATLRDNFDNLEAKHHVLQAVKFLGVTESPFEEKEKVYDTVLPFNGKVRGFKKQKKLTDIIKKLFGYSYKIEEETDLKLRVRGNPEFLPELINEAKDIGYNEVEIDMFHRDFKKLESSGLEGKITYKEVNEEKRKINPEILKTLTRGLIICTAPVSYTLLGSLPGDLQERIESYVNGRGYNGRIASTISNWVGFAGGFGGGIYNWASTGKFLSPITLLGFYTGIESIARGVVTTKGFDDHLDPKIDKIGRIPLLPITLPIKGLIHLTGNKEGKGSYVRVNLKLKNKKDKDATAPKTVDDTVNMFEYFGKVAQIEVPENLEQNLVWSTENHNNYSKEFSDYLKSRIKSLEGKRPDFGTSVDRKNQRYDLFGIKRIDSYNKITMLACSKGERYVLSFITNQSEHGNEQYINSCNEIVASNLPLIDKAKQVTSRLNTHYTHLAKLENGKLVGDYEIVS